MPLTDSPGGLLLDRIVAMIAGSEIAFFDIGLPNGNVWFELGVSSALGIPTVFLSDQEPLEHAEILRSPWICTYRGDSDCLDGLVGFLNRQKSAEPVLRPVNLERSGEILVIGSGPRAETISEEIQQTGQRLTLRDPRSIQTPTEAVRAAQSFGAVVGIKPDLAEWDEKSAAASLIVLGAAVGLRRPTVIAADSSERVPSDCEKLVIRNTDDRQLAADAISLLGQQTVFMPLSGTTRPRNAGEITRRLSKTISRGLRQQGLALLSTEPGYGKTTLLGQIATELGYPVCWVTIGANWDVTDVLERVVTTVGQYVPAFGWEAWSVVKQYEDSITRVTRESKPLLNRPNPIQLAESVSSELGPIPSNPVLLVVDDLHKTTDEGAQFLTRLSATKPNWLLIAFAGRGAPSELNSEASIGRIPSWGPEELKFSRHETREFLRQTVRRLDKRHADILHRRCGGWPAALALMRAWFNAHPEATAQDLEEMARGDRRQIYKTFAGSFFDHLKETIKRDLLSVSLPQTVDATVAQHLLGTDGAERLRALVDGPYFLVEHAAGEFQFHSLFREFLNQRWVEERGINSLRSAKSNLAAWYLETGQATAAFGLAVESENWDTAINAIEPLLPAFHDQGDLAWMATLLEQIPKEWKRKSQIVWGSWVQALSHIGSPIALEEIRSPPTFPESTADETAFSRLVVVSLKHNFGMIDDGDLGVVCERIASELMPGDQLALQARLIALDANSVRNANAAQWPKLHDQAVELTNDAEKHGVLDIAAAACATAFDLANRIAQNVMKDSTLAESLRQNLGIRTTIESRIENAESLVESQVYAHRLRDKALELSKKSNDPRTTARIRLTFAGSITYNSSLEIIKSGEINDFVRFELQTAHNMAIQAAEFYSQAYTPRDFVVAYNAAAQAAVALNDIGRRDELTKEAIRIASQFGYKDLIENSVSIANGPTPLEVHRAAQGPHSLFCARSD